MKKFIPTVVILLGTTLSAMAILGQPIADDANTDAGLIRFGGGITLEGDVNLYAGRFTYGPIDDLALFIGGGFIDPDSGDIEPFLQLGSQYRLPIYDIPFDLAIRGAFGLSRWDDSGRHAMGSWKSETDFWSLNVGALGSKDLDVITVYGFAGLSYMYYDSTITRTMTFPAIPEPETRRERFSDSDSDVELALAGGVIYWHNHNVSYYGELALIDDLFISIGARYQF